MNTLIIAEAELIIKDDATVQLRISAVLLRKAGRWDAPYAPLQSIKLFSFNMREKAILEKYKNSKKRHPQLIPNPVSAQKRKE